jgi:hypothetical protein
MHDLDLSFFQGHILFGQEILNGQVNDQSTFLTWLKSWLRSSKIQQQAKALTSHMS